MQTLKISVTVGDVGQAEKFKISNPILYALQCLTGTLWQMLDDGTVREVMAPFRSGQLTDEPLRSWQRYLSSHEMEPFEFDLELQESLLQTANSLNHDDQQAHLSRASESLLSHELTYLSARSE